MIRCLALIQKYSEGSLYYRHIWPSKHLQNNGIISDYTFIDSSSFFVDTLPDMLDKYDVLVTPRIVWRESWMADKFRALLNQHHIAWIYEADDDLFSPETVEQTVAFGMQLPQNQTIEPVEREARLREQAQYSRDERVRILGMVDGITVSTEHLSETIRPYTSVPIHVVQNALDLEFFNTAYQRVEKPLTIGWAGSIRDPIDVEAMSKAWLRIAYQFPKVHFAVYGWNIPRATEYLPPSRLHYFAPTKFENYPSTLKNIDIGCCSVADMTWNLNKSSIKFYEYAASKIPCVGSHAVYGRDITDGTNGLLSTTIDEWESALSAMVLDTYLRNTLVNHAYTTVRTQHNITHNWNLWSDAWTAIRESIV